MTCRRNQLLKDRRDENKKDADGAHSVLAANPEKALPPRSACFMTSIHYFEWATDSSILAACHTFTVPSLLLTASVVPFLEKATEVTILR